MKTLKIFIILQLLICLKLTAVDVTYELYHTEDVKDILNGTKTHGNFQTLFHYKNCIGYKELDIYEQKLNEIDKYKLTLPIRNYGVDLNIDSIGYLPGESVKHSLRTKEGIVLQEVEFIPNPLVAESKIDGAFVYLKLKCIPITMYEVYCEGFKNDEIVQIKSISGDEVLNFNHCTNSMSLYMPGILGKTGGVAKYIIKRESGEKLRITLPWGLEIMKHLCYADKDGNPIFLYNHPSAWKQLEEGIDKVQKSYNP